MNNILEKLNLYNSIISEAKDQQFSKGDKVEIKFNGKRGKIEKVLEYDKIISDYQYEVKVGSKTEVYAGSELKEA